MSFNAIAENKILAKSSESTVSGSACDSLGEFNKLFKMVKPYIQTQCYLGQRVLCVPGVSFKADSVPNLPIG